MDADRVAEVGSVADTIFERCGGFAGVSRIVSSLYDEVLDSEVLAPYFHLGISHDAFDEIVAILRDVLEDHDFEESDICVVYTAMVQRRSFIVTRSEPALSRP